MKRRFIIAAVSALSIHLFLFSANFGFLAKDIHVSPATNVIHMSFSSPKNKPSDPKTNKKKNKKKEINQHTPTLQNESDKTNKDSETSDKIESVAVTHKAKPLGISNKPPGYPKIAQIRGYQGTVILRVLVNIHGTVSKIIILKSSGYWILDKSALTAVKDWKFVPGSNGKDNIESWVEQPIRFQLK